MSIASYFDKKVCVVTGAAAGIGLALAQQLAKTGASVCMADINQKLAETEALALRKDGFKAEAYELDVCDAAAMERLVDSIKKRQGRIDLFFNNAGVAVLGEIRDFQLEHWQKVLHTNLFGTLYGIHHVYPIMIAQKSGHIVNIASGFGLSPGPIYGPYVTSKFAVVGLSDVLRTEAKDLGIDVTVVCPGFIETQLVQSVQILKANAAAYQKQIPVGMVKVDVAARIILQGVARKKARVLFPGYVGILATLYKLWPSLYFKMGLSQIRKFRSIRQE